MAEGWLYEFDVEETARFRARGLDAAARISGRVKEVVAAALEADPEVLEVEDQMWLRAQPQRCERSASCRGNLHYDDCPHRKGDPNG